MKRIPLTLITLLLTLTACALPAFTRLDVSHGLSDNRVQHILQLPDGRMALTTLGNINIYDGRGFRYIHRSDSDVHTLDTYGGAYHVYVGEGDLLWVKDHHRVWCLDLRHERYLHRPADVFRQMGLHDRVTDLFVDSQRALWLVTRKGLWQASRKRYIGLPPRSGELQDLDVADGQLFLFFNTGQVAVMDVESGRLLYTRDAYGPEERDLYSYHSLVVRGPDGNFYQLRNGLRTIFLCFSPRTRSWRRLTENQGMPFHTLIVPDKRTAYISSFKGIYKVDVRTGETNFINDVRTADDTIVSTTFNTIFLDSQGGFWLGTGDQGALYAHPQRFRLATTTAGDHTAPDGRQRQYGGQNYNDVITDSRGWTWAGTPDGLRLFTPQGQRMLFTEDGLSNNYVHAITEDRKGDIWASTSHGITRIHATTADSLAFTAYGTADGTLAGEYADGDVCLLPDGRILMGGPDGVTAFHPDSVDVPVRHFTPLPVSVAVNGEPLAFGTDTLAVPYLRHYDFSHLQNSVAFVFSALNYAWPTHTLYRYRLVTRADSAWHTVRPTAPDGSLSLHFALLPPGYYRLEVQASTRPDMWEGPCTQVAFVIHAPWWRTRTAMAIYVIITMVLCALGVRTYVSLSRQRLMRRHKEEILLMRIQNLIERCDNYERLRRDQEEATAAAAIEEEEEETPALSAADSEFLNRAVTLVEANIGMAGYSVEQLSKDLCMERTGLYKRLTALLDKSPSLFIRSIRLKHAAALIEAGGMTMAEVADRVGFSSSAYMSRCFQEEYGCKPSEYARVARKST